MLWDIFILIAGLALIMGGANILTDGASALARRWGVSDLVLGLTIVAFGTSTPELAISVTSAIQGNTGIAVGNVVGSNIFNILVIVGAIALVRPVRITRDIMVNEIPMVVLSSTAILAIGMAPLLGVPGAAMVSRVDGILLLLFFLIFMHYILQQARHPVPGADPAPDATPATKKEMGLLKGVIWVLGGLAALVIGGDIFVKGASGIARGLGVGEAIIGLTIVAMGTSLPDLAASVAAARKGNTGIAVGNVIGSCVFNAFMVLGAAAAVRPLPFGGIGMTDLVTLAGASVLFWLFGWFFRKRTITRWEGGVMILCYIAYITYLVLAELGKL